MTLSQLTESGLASSGSTCDPNGYGYAIHFFTDRKDEIHWARASGLSMLAGFKKVTDGGLDVAINALLLDSRPHRRPGINQSGQVTVIRIRVDGCGHLILKGSDQPSYDIANELLLKLGLRVSPARYESTCAPGQWERPAGISAEWLSSAITPR